ncbi:hypothetical protein [Blastococcus sp. KM273129]|uniref:hypothetical protein n=1 Tax=Blastococcus sp. KM273129 TaxID=2570315 RepID=UPI001F485907|nr:hypothetical protein [Blastococcus sp. KM273129]MCF6737615.1 hypothetical protein [Blastococcus sp. KM273129]
MASNGPDPREFLDMAQRMLRQLFDEPRREDQTWADVTREAVRRRPEPSAEEQRENLTFALATRAVEALEDLALNVAAIRQRLERTAAGSHDRSARREAPPER